MANLRIELISGYRFLPSGFCNIGVKLLFECHSGLHPDLFENDRQRAEAGEGRLE
jgi:hypothetical protein